MVDVCDRKIRRLASLTLLAFGLAYVGLIPPFEAPDEPSHFARALGIAEGQFVLRDHPRALVGFIKDTLEIRHDQRNYLVAETGKLLNRHPGRIPNFALNTALYSPVPYLIDAGIIRLVSLKGVSRSSLQWSLYLCRAASLLTFLGLLHLALHLFPTGTWPLFWVVATPMALSQASVVSTDFLVLGISILLIAAALSSVASILRTLCLSAAPFLLLLTKPNYLPLALIPWAAVLLNPQDRRLRGSLSSLAGFTVAGLAGACAWNYLIHRHGVYARIRDVMWSIGGVEMNPAGQLQQIMTAPLNFGWIVLDTLNQNGLKLLHQFVGVLGNLDLPLPFWAAALWGLSLPLAVSIADTPPIAPPVRRWLGWCCLAAGLAAGLAVFVSAFMLWAPTGSRTVNLQGRYFHAVMASVLVGTALVASWRIDGRCRIWGQAGMLSSAVLINTVALYTLWEAYGVGFLRFVF